MTSVPGIQLAGLSSSLATPGSGRFFTKNRFLRWKVARDTTLQALAGHLSSKMMEHYSHVRMAAKKAAAGTLGTGMGSVPTTREKRKRGQKQSRKKKIDATP
jgi:hypothetical protein